MVGPIQALRAGAARIGSGDLSQQIRIKTGDELEELADQFNDMAGRAAGILCRPGTEGGSAHPRAERLARAADGYVGGPSSHQQLAWRSRPGVPGHAGERDAAVRSQIRDAVSLRRKRVPKRCALRCAGRLSGDGAARGDQSSSSRRPGSHRSDEAGRAHRRLKGDTSLPRRPSARHCARRYRRRSDNPGRADAQGE